MEVKVLKTVEVLDGKVLNIYGTVDEPQFLAKDVMTILDMDTTSVGKFVARLVGKSTVTVMTKGGPQQTAAVTSEGLIQAIAKTRKICAKDKATMLGALGLSSKVVLVSAPEIEFLTSIETIISVLGYSLEKQKAVGTYRLDGYIPELNINIEFDELQHLSNVEADKTRQEYIISKLNCKVVRCDIRDSKDYNIGLVMKALLDK